jgi:hypothetical protein
MPGVRAVVDGAHPRRRRLREQASPRRAALGEVRVPGMKRGLAGRRYPRFPPIPAIEAKILS